MAIRKDDYSKLAGTIVRGIGGKENIVNVTNCMTRLRFVLKDDSIANESELKAIKGVQGVVNKGGQYQVIIGTHVGEVVKDVRAEAGIIDDRVEAEINDDRAKPDMSIVKKDSLFNRFFKVISGCFTPIIGLMVASGIIKGVLTIFTTAGILTSKDGTYMIMYAAANAVMYFLPVVLGFAAGKVFNCNPFVTAVIGAALVYPDIVGLKDAGQSISFLGIPVTLVTYAQSFFPIIAGAWFASKVEHLSIKFIPRMMQLMFVPAITLAISVPVIYLAIGPLMTLLSDGLSNVVLGVFNISPIIGGILFGAFWQLVVLLGLHNAFVPVLINNMTTLGSDPINAVLGLTVFALAGVSLGYALKMRNPEKRSIGFGTLASCLCGVTEPTIYSIAMQKFKLFICAWIGGGVAGGIFAGLGGKMYAWGGDGLFRLPSMINPQGLDVSFYGFVGCALLAMVVSAVLSYFVADAE
ncbi:PTS transporter subunit EIIC [Niallia taxi]|uniref:PTS transporter subunit EIIC n=1 Tax=Niallia taxi TaxID=2499688 RepID=UPI002E1DF22E|nr:PTS transporter subunit EIIC [Niallia taxi]MED3960882.1 PTS transporter subunit EIIC [Niallia taxi]